MKQNTQEPTLTVQGITPYAQVPLWIIRSGNRLSLGARALYACIMSYASNDTRTAFPGRETLARDLGVSVSTVKRNIKELEDFGALSVDRRRNKRTGNFYANHYTLAFTSPWATHDPRPGVASDPIAIPMLTTPTTHSTSDSGESDEKTFHAQNGVLARENDHLPKTEYMHLRGLLQRVGEVMSQGNSFHDDPVITVWQEFANSIEYACEHLSYSDTIIDLVWNGKWTVSANVADPYIAGTELTKLLNSARAGI